MKTAIYVRVSTEDQTTELQLHDISIFLQSKGILEFEVFEDRGISGLAKSRPSLDALLKRATGQPRPDKIDLVVIWKLDRLFRSLMDLMTTVKSLSDSKCAFIAVRDNIDLTTPSGTLMLHMIGAFAQFERDLISERTRSGLSAAKSRGVLLGRPTTIGNSVITEVQTLRSQGLSIMRIAERTGFSGSKVARALKRIS